MLELDCPSKSEHVRRTKLKKARDAFEIRRKEHPDPEAYKALLDAIIATETGRSSVDFELDTSAVFDLAFEELRSAAANTRSR